MRCKIALKDAVAREGFFQEARHHEAGRGLDKRETIYVFMRMHLIEFEQQ
jgi:hypothetical protein